LPSFPKLTLRQPVKTRAALVKDGIAVSSAMILHKINYRKMKFMIQAGGILGALAVALGAFGAHALKTMLEASGRSETFETAVKYQFYHALAMVLVGLLMQRAGAEAVKLLGWSGNAFAVGVIIFSGSLYAICFTGITKFGATAPIGGLALIAGWILLILAAGKLA
jgi:uncharacterized membrane protein YgdD (TMEM256/DUF423 family)